VWILCTGYLGWFTYSASVNLAYEPMEY